MDRFPTHVVKSNGGELVSEIGHRANRDRFAKPLRRFNGRERWALGLFPIPEDTDYDNMLAIVQEFTEFLQAGGAADALTIQIRKPGGEQWGCKWVRYVVGHRDVADGPFDVDIPMHNGVLTVKAAEVFDAEKPPIWSTATTRPAMSRPGTRCVPSRATSRRFSCRDPY